MKYIPFFCLFFIPIYSCIAQDINLKTITTATEKAVQHEIDNHFKINCPEVKTSTQVRFYNSELQFFAIEEAFQEIKSLKKSNRIRKRDFIYLVLYYPIVGFDPETGYTTQIFLKQKFRKNTFKEFSIEEKRFKGKPFKSKYLKRLTNAKSECYHTGYLLLFKFDRDLKIVNTKAALSISLY